MAKFGLLADFSDFFAFGDFFDRRETQQLSLSIKKCHLIFYFIYICCPPEPPFPFILAQRHRSTVPSAPPSQCVNRSAFSWPILDFMQLSTTEPHVSTHINIFVAVVALISRGSRLRTFVWRFECEWMELHPWTCCCQPRERSCITCPGRMLLWEYHELWRDLCLLCHGSPKKHCKWEGGLLLASLRLFEQ